MKCVLVGAVESTRVTLDAMVRHGVAPLALVTLPQAKSHRHSDFTDVASAARSHSIPVIEVADSNSTDLCQQLEEMQLDWIFVVGWSQICKPRFIEIPRIGVIGYHPSVLPKNRGRGVLPWTILQRARKAGASIFWIDKGVDSGDLMIQTEFEVAPDETARSLYDKHSSALSQMWDDLIPSIVRGETPRTPQDSSGATWCAKRIPSDGHIDWKQSAEEIWTLIRAVGKPYPGAFSYFPYEDTYEKVVIWDAELVGEAPFVGIPGQIQKVRPDGILVQCGDGQHLLLKSLQRENGSALASVSEFKIHQRFGIDLVRMYDVLRNKPNDAKD